MPKHAVIISDMHCGHLFGMTPPMWWMPESDKHEEMKIATWQRKTWEWLATKAAKIGPIDHLIVNGDAIEGSGDRSGGTELITTDRHKQVEMAFDTINLFDFDKITIIRGTPYHTGEKEDYEDVLAQKYFTYAQDHAWLEYAGCIIDFKHYVGSSTIPGTIPQSLTRDAVWNLMWAEHEMQPRAKVFIRSHLHHFYQAGDDDCLCLVTPALQGWTKYGGRKMSKTISFGFLEISISDEGEFGWKKYGMIPRFAAAKAESM